MSALKLYDLKTHEELSPHDVDTKPVGFSFEVFQDPAGDWHTIPSDRFKTEFPHLSVRRAYLSPVSLGPVESP